MYNSLSGIVDHGPCKYIKSPFAIFVAFSQLVRNLQYRKNIKVLIIKSWPGPDEQVQCIKINVDFYTQLKFLSVNSCCEVVSSYTFLNLGTRNSFFLSQLVKGAKK